MKYKKYNHEGNMLTELNKFKTQLLDEYIKCGVVDADYLYRMIDNTLSRPEIIYIREKKSRQKRDEFIFNLIHIIPAEFHVIHKMLRSKWNLLNVSENLFDRLSSFINQCEISKQDEAVQAWSYIKRVESEFKMLYEKITGELSKKPRGHYLSPYIKVEDEDGNVFCIDSASEHLIRYLSITLKLLSHKFGWFSDDKVIMPDEVGVEDDNIYQAGSIELLARSWIALEDISQRSLIFGGDVYVCKGEHVPEDARAAGVKTSYHYERTESEYELYDAIACERVRRKSLQEFINIISSKEIRNAVTRDPQNVGKIEDGSFFSEEEILACFTLGDTFCVDIMTDSKGYHGLTLAEWVRCYFVLQNISRRMVEENSHGILVREKIIDALEMAGIDREKCLIFINLVSFSKDSTDLYDCPLIAMRSGAYYISYNSLLHANISNIILSRLSSLDTNTTGKGYKFESEVNELIRKVIGDCKSFKFKRGADEYEYDATFILDGNLFILECKNRSLSWYNPVRSYRNKKFIYDAAQQVKRLRGALLEYPEVVKEQFGVECSDVNIIPVVFNCLPFSWRGSIDEVYVTDYSSFSRLLKGSEIYKVMSSLNGQENIKSGYKQWKGHFLCSEDIIRHFENPIQLAPFIDSRKEDYKWWVADSEVAFMVKSFEVDTKEYAKREKKLFISLPLKKQKKPKIDRKAMEKKSKKINRRK